MQMVIKGRGGSHLPTLSSILSQTKLRTLYATI